jgi:hypothetical protein
MAPEKIDAVFPSVLESDQPRDPSRECAVVVLDSVQLRQELSGSVVESAPQRRIFEILAPDGRSLVTLEKAM